MLLYHTIACIPPISKIILKIVLFQEKNHNNNDDDLVSLYIFGEDESVLAAEADINNGVVSYHKVAKHHYKDRFFSQNFTKIQQLSYIYIQF
jgi:hypothetical protein